MAGFFRQLVASISIFAIVFQPLVASANSITIDGSAPRANQATIGTSSSGKPLINIVKPNSGVSHNRYNTLNTTSGAIFNNSTVNGTTATGGTARANANLGGTTAKIILNEVRGSAATSIKGSNEIFGAKADLIIANERGVTCNGCVFVNTGKATLSTGRPIIAGGVVTMDVRKGAVNIGRNGASGADRINLVGRTVKIDGPVNSGWIDAVAGANKYKTNDGTYTPGTKDGAAGSFVAVDATKFGALTAGHIRVIGTEAGLGVRTIGNLKSTAGSIVLRSGGNLEYTNVDAKKDLWVTAGAGRTHQRNGTVKVGRNATINGRDFSQAYGGKLNVGGTLKMNMTSTVTIAGEVNGAAVNVDTTGRFANYGTVISTGDISVVAGEVFNVRPDEFLKDFWGATESDPTAAFVGAIYFDPYAMLNSQASTWTDRVGNTLAGGVLAAQNVTMTSRVGDVQNNGVVIASKNVLVNAKKTFYQRSLRGVYRATANATYKKTDLALAKSAVTRTAIATALGADAGNRYQNIRDPYKVGNYVYTGTKLDGRGKVAVTAAHHIYNLGGGIRGWNEGVDLTTTAYDIYLQDHGRYSHVLSQKKALNIVAKRNLHLRKAAIQTLPHTVQMNASTIYYDQPSIDATKFSNLIVRSNVSAFNNPFTIDTAGYVDIRAGSTLTNTKTIKAGRSLRLESINHELRQNALVTAGAGTGLSAVLKSKSNLNSKSATAEGRLDLISTQGSVTIQGNARSTKNLTNISAHNHIINGSSTLYGKTGINATAGLGFTNTNGRIWSDGDINILAGRRSSGSISSTHSTAAAASGYIRSYGAGKNVLLDTDRGSITLSNNAAIAPGTVTLDASGEVWVKRSNVTGSSVRLNAKTNYIVNELGSKITANTGGIVLNGPVSIYNRGGALLKAKTDVYARGQNVYNHGGLINAGRDARLLPIGLFQNHKSGTQRGSIIAARNVNVTSDTNYLWNVDSDITAGGTLNFNSGAHQVHKNSVFTAGGLATMTAKSYINFEAGSLTANGITSNTTSYLVLNPESRLESTAGNIDVVSGNLLYNRNSTITTPGNLSVTSKGVENDGAVIRAGNYMTFNSAGSWRNINAYSKAGHISAGKSINLKTTAGSIWNRSSTLAAGTHLTMNSASNMHNDKTTLRGLGGSTIIKSGGEFRQTGGSLKTRGIDIDSKHHLYMFTNGVMTATHYGATFNAFYDFNIQDSAITAKTFINQKDSRHNYIYDTNLTAGTDVTMKTRGELRHRQDNTDRTVTVAGGNVTLTSGGLMQNYYADITSGGAVSMVTGGKFYNQNATIVAPGNIAITSKGVDNDGSVIGTDGYLTFNSAGSWRNIDSYSKRSKITADKSINLQVTSGSIWNRKSDLVAGTHLTMNSVANTHNERAVLRASTGSAVIKSGGEFRQTGGTLTARGIDIDSKHHLYMFADGLMNATHYGTTFNAFYDFNIQDSAITAKTFINQKDSRHNYIYDTNLTAGTDIDLKTRGLIQHRIWDTDRTTTIAGGDINMTSGSYLQNYRADMTAGGDITLKSTANYVDNYGGTITAGTNAFLTGQTRVHNRNHTTVGSIVAGRRIELRSNTTDLYLTGSKLQAGEWLRLFGRNTPTIDAAAAANAKYLHLGVFTYAGAFNNPFTVDTKGAVDFYASGDLTNTKNIYGDNWVRLRSTGGKITNTGYAYSRTRWTTLEASKDIVSYRARAATDLTVKSKAGSITNTYAMQAGQLLNVDAYTDFRNAAKVATRRNVVSGNTGVEVIAGQHIDLTNTEVRSGGALKLSAGQRVKGDLTTRTLHKDRQALIRTTNGGAINIVAQGGGNVISDGAWLNASGSMSVYAGGQVLFGAGKVAGHGLNSRIDAATSINVSGGKTVLDATNIGAGTTAILRARHSGLSGHKGSIVANNISMLSQGEGKNIVFTGLSQITARNALSVESKFDASLNATNIRAQSFDFTNTRITNLHGAITKTGSSDLVLSAVGGLSFNGTTQKRDIAITSIGGNIRNAGHLKATRNLTLTSKVSPNQDINARVGLDTVVSNPIGVQNVGRLWAGNRVTLSSNRSIETGFVRAQDIVIRSNRADVFATGALIAERSLNLRAAADIDTRSVFAADAVITADHGSFRVSGWDDADTVQFKTGRADFANLMSARIGDVGDEVASTDETEVITEENVNAAFRTLDSALFHSATDLTLNVKQDVIALNGGMISGEGDVTINADRNILVTSSKTPRSGQDDRLNRSGILSDGVMSLTAGRDILNDAGTISSKGDMFVVAGRNIRNAALKTEFILRAEHDCEGNACGRKGFTYTPGELLSGRGMIIGAGGTIRNRASQIASAGSVSIHAGSHVINEALKGQFRIVDVYEKKKFLFITTSVLVKVVNKVEIGSSVIQTEFGDIFVKSDTGDVLSPGSYLSSGGSLTVEAGRDIVLNAVSEEAQNVYKKRGFRGFSYSSNKTYWNNFGTAMSMLEAGDSITLDAGRDIAGIGASIMSLNDVTITAGRDVVYDAKQNEKYKIDKGWSIGFSTSGFPITTALLDSGTRGALQAYVNDNPAIAAVHKLATAQDGWGTLNGTLALIWHGSDLLASANSVFAQVGGQTSMSSALAQQFIPTDYQTFTNLLDGCGGGTLAESCAAAVGISFRFEMWETRQDWTETYISQIGAGRDLTITADRDIVLAGGSVVSAAVDARLTAGRDLIMAAVADNTHTTSRSWGLSVGIGTNGVTVGGHAEGSNAVQTIFSNAALTAGETLYASSGQDTILLGARMSAQDIFVTAGRDLTLASRQNTAESSQWGFNASLTFGPGGVPTGFSLGGNYGRGSRYFTDTPSWIQAAEVNNIYVGRTTYLMGAVLSSDNDGLILDTGSFIFDNYDDSDLSWSVGGSIGGSIDPTEGLQNLSGNFNASYSNTEGVTYATVAGGQVRVRDNPDANLDGLNTDINNVSVVTEETYFAIEIPGINLAVLRENLEASGNFLRAATANVPDFVRAQGSAGARLYRRMIANGVSVADANGAARTDAFRAAVNAASNVAVLMQRYGSLDLVPEDELVAMMFAEGALYDAQGQLTVSVNCDLAGRCEMLASELAEFYSAYLEQIRDGVALRDRILAEKFRQFLIACAEEDPNFIIDFRNTWGEETLSYLVTMSSGAQADYRANNTYSNILGYDPAILNAALDRYELNGSQLELRIGMVEAAIQFYEVYGYLPADPQDMTYSDGREGLLLALGFVPIVGTAVAGYEFYIDYQSGNVVGASINGIGIVVSMIPVGGGVIRMIMRGGDEVIDVGGDAGQALVRGLDEVSDVGASFFSGASVGQRSALRANLIAQYPELAMAGWQAHHIIPWDFVDHPLLQRLGVNLNDIGNGMPLGTSVAGACSATHCGSHPAYNDAIELFLDTLNSRGLPDNVARNMLTEGMDTLRGSLNSSTPLRNVDGATTEMWTNILGL